MRKVSILVIFIATFVFSMNLLVSLPVHFYQEAVNKGVESEFLNLKKLPSVFYDESQYELSKVDWLYEDEELRWKLFHFVNYNIPFPVRHPLYLVVPEMELDVSGTRAGYKLLNNSDNKKMMFKFMDEEVKELRLDFESQRLFRLPIFKNFILSKSVPQIWKDIFKMSFKNDPYLDKFSVTDKLQFWNMPYQEMVYRLFILHMRMKVFPKDLIKYGFYDSNNLGIVEVVDKKTRDGKLSDYKEELIYIRSGNRYFIVRVSYVIDDKIAMTARNRILEGISLKPTTERSSNVIFNEYQTLEYKRKIDQEGMIYLYSAWSHEQERREFMEKMIQFLERGEQDKSHLHGLYQFAYSKYGTSFSKNSGMLKESQSEKLKRKISEELEDKIYKEKMRETIKTDGKFESNEDKIKFFLRKAKDSGEDTSEDLDSVEIQ